MSVTTDAQGAAQAGPDRAYMRIAAELRRRVEEGELRPGDSVPPERELCVEFGVSRMTARRALTVLESEGVVYRGGTRGTFVADPRVELRLGSFSQEVSRAGRHPGAELFWADSRPAAREVADALGLREGDAVVALQRLRRSNDEPIAVETTYYPASLAPGLLEGDLTGSIWEELRDRFDVVPRRTVAKLEVVALDAEIAGHLGARTAAGGIRLIRRTYDVHDRCIEYAVDVYRADRVSLIIEREV